MHIKTVALSNGDTLEVEQFDTIPEAQQKLGSTDVLISINLQFQTRQIYHHLITKERD